MWLISKFLYIHFDEITICSLLNALFIRCFKLICTARVIDSVTSQADIILSVPYRTVAISIVIWEKEHQWWILFISHTRTSPKER